MQNEIERKFLVKELPHLSGIEKIGYERYFLFNENGIELRVQRKGEKYELERKVKVSDIERTREKITLTEAEFTVLKTLGQESILRDSYTFSESPNISLKIYHGKHKGLMRAEVECDSVEELADFTPLPWFGEEITHSPLARDAELLKLSGEEFNRLIKK